MFSQPYPQSPRKVIPTPEPTPCSSPVASSPPATSPLYTPIQSVEIEDERPPNQQAPLEPQEEPRVVPHEERLEEPPAATMLEESLEPSSASVDIVDMMNKIAGEWPPFKLNFEYRAVVHLFLLSCKTSIFFNSVLLRCHKKLKWNAELWLSL